LIYRPLVRRRPWRRPVHSRLLSARRHKHWGWGYEDQQPPPDAVAAAARGMVAHLGFGSERIESPVPLQDVSLPAARVRAPAGLSALCEADVHARASHGLGKSYSDVVRGFRGRYDHPPDLVVRPAEERDVERVLEWCASANLAVVPFGGGTSVVGGVEPNVGVAYDGAVSLDLRGLDRVLEVDPISRSARIQAGATGPGLEGQLAAHGLTLRHFPQSFEYSTLGGWVATRAAGHYATGPTHIEDFIESVRAVTPSGTWASWRLPGSGAGPSPDRMLVGSEGTLGVITEAWMRVRSRPRHRASAAVCFDAFLDGAECVRAISQSGLLPANCRLIDAQEARMTFAGDGSAALLVLGFESDDHPVAQHMDRALALCAEHGGRAGEPRPSQGDASATLTHTPPGGGDVHERGAVGSWRSAFLQAPYLRDVFVAMGVLSETFETAITWERFPALHERVMATAGQAVADACGLRAGAGPGSAHVSCRLTHVYADGPAPYYTVLAPAVRGEEVDQWAAVKRAVSDVLSEAGATITHHHAVGRDHRPWYDRQRPDVFAAALTAAKRAVDPVAILNPGVLVDGQR